jgi:hypothetical protein
MSLISRYNKLKEEKPSTAIAILLGIGLGAYLILQFIQTQISEEYQVLKEMIKKITIVISIICLISPFNILLYSLAQRFRKGKRS